ncbi:MAG: hypothetical protein GTO53_05930 [Planctomycetales bacterium]|nr:hypothetical protein [Planctomycetales bacterium]NIM08683.1 hypothetical protein [Planctomycetales bacterium]NIN08157.1 hypothetical protein [Planctomycetales bacterium]NIN77284.1 hypothetical protein [Planctomycetales bacterium]NIO34468.1 hypothetical protein [Planctomycetales bacterium]
MKQTSQIETGMLAPLARIGQATSLATLPTHTIYHPPASAIPRCGMAFAS